MSGYVFKLDNRLSSIHSCYITIAKYIELSESAQETFQKLIIMHLNVLVHQITTMSIFP